ncbi:winged helix-turn-helix transcriptional regulator [Anaerococcus obesiensis]|uniref:Winged helix-turn-helix transcriptional regulator n=1 Tax=Anaerococcus obesiensis TaxID=1287640 RepID=A0A7T7UTL9_9FIRM|nr:metalloregulator ArsR/SmtB family transcription factor [Anaerococcus obesiensis]QQN55997.1 winged helix-turn-helix transcriptional regulator [Anaerococcus obesiensis]
MKLPHKHYKNDDKIDFLLEEEKASDISKAFRHLGDSKRLQIFWLLCHRKECVINIAAIMGMSSPAISHHLKILKTAGLISSKREGKEMFYKANDNKLSEFMFNVILDTKNL